MILKINKLENSNFIQVYFGISKEEILKLNECYNTITEDYGNYCKLKKGTYYIEIEIDKDNKHLFNALLIKIISYFMIGEKND